MSGTLGSLPSAEERGTDVCLSPRSGPGEGFCGSPAGRQQLCPPPKWRREAWYVLNVCKIEERRDSTRERGGGAGAAAGGGEAAALGGGGWTDGDLQAGTRRVTVSLRAQLCSAIGGTHPAEFPFSLFSAGTRVPKFPPPPPPRAGPCPASPGCMPPALLVSHTR